MPTNAQAYAAKVRELIDRAHSLSAEAQRELLRLLVEANKRIIGQIATADSKSYTSAQLQLILRQIDEAMARFRQEATEKLAAIQERSAIAATHDTSAVVSAGLGSGVSYGAVNQNTLRIVQGYTADLVSGLSADAAGKLKAAVQRGFLGGQPWHQVINDVGHALEGGKFSGLFSSVGDRAMSVAMNETLRIHSIAGHARLLDLARRNAKIKKKWVHVPAARVPRVTHLLAGEMPPIPVDQAYVVAGEELMFPRDPSGRPDNTISCHCMSIPWIDDADLYATDADREVLRKAGLFVAAKESLRPASRTFLASRNPRGQPSP